MAAAAVALLLRAPLLVVLVAAAAWPPARTGARRDLISNRGRRKNVNCGIDGRVRTASVDLTALFAVK